MKFNNNLSHTDRFLLKWSLQEIDISNFKLEYEQLKHKINWEIFIKHSIDSHLAGYFLENTKKAKINLPEHVEKSLINYQNKLLMHHIFMLESLKVLNENLKLNNIEHVFLKGWDLAIRNYCSLKTRHISDIDLLVNPKQLHDLLKILENLGALISISIHKSKLHNRIEELHAPAQALLNGISIDIHTRLFSAREKYNFETTHLLSNKETHLFQNQIFHLLNENDAALYCSLHAYKHLSTGTSLKPALINDFYYYNKVELVNYSKKYAVDKELLSVVLFQHEIFTFKNKIGFFTFNFYRFLSQRRITTFESILILVNRTKSFTINKISLLLFYYDVFPQRSYMKKNFGGKIYLISWLKRIYNFINLLLKPLK